jgi:hypothetical protein
MTNSQNGFLATEAWKYVAVLKEILLSLQCPLYRYYFLTMPQTTQCL